MNQIHTTRCIVILLISMLSFSEILLGTDYVKTSGISKTFTGPFIMTKENAQDITARILKAQEKLTDKSDVYVYFHRSDNRYFEVSTIAKLFDDPNSSYASIDYVSWNLLQNYPEDPKAAGPRRIMYVRYSISEKNVLLSIDGREMDWALLAADDLEFGIKRTIVSGWNYVNLLILLFAIATYFYLSRLIAKLINTDKFKAREMEFIIDLQLIMLIQMPPILFIIWIATGWEKFVGWLNNSSSYFLWGDVVATYSKSSQLNNNFLWAVAVGLLVAIFANVATPRLLAMRIVKKGKNDTPNGGTTSDSTLNVQPYIESK